MLRGNSSWIPAVTSGPPGRVKLFTRRHAVTTESEEPTITLAPAVQPEVFRPQIHLPTSLGGLVDVIAELREPRPARRLIMPGGKVELAIFLDATELDEFYMGWDEQADRGRRKDFSLLFSVANRPQIVSARKIHILLALMSPAAAMLMFSIPASELTNRSVNPESLGIHMTPLQDRLNALPTFSLRAQFLEQWMLNRIRRVTEAPRFLGLSRRMVDLFGDGRLVADTEQLPNMSGYSPAHANRLAKQWLGLSLERYRALQIYRRALSLLNSPMSLAEVAATAGYFDQAHFTRTFTKYSGISPGHYRTMNRTGADTLHVA